MVYLLIYIYWTMITFLGVESTWSGIYIFLFLLDFTLKEFWGLSLSEILAYNIIFWIGSLSGFGVRAILASQKENVSFLFYGIIKGVLMLVLLWRSYGILHVKHLGQRVYLFIFQSGDFLMTASISFDVVSLLKLFVLFW